MIPWILLFASGLALIVLFVRRLRMTQKDLLFQKNLEEQVALEQAEKLEESPFESPNKFLGSIRKTYLKADTHFSREEWTEAEQLLRLIVENDPEHLDAHHKLGLIYMKRGDFSNAELYFSKLVNLKQDPVYFSNLGAALYQQQRLVEAAEAYQNALALDDRRAERLQSLAQVYYELGDEEKALYYFERAAQRKPKDLDLKFILADFYERMVRLEDAVRVLGSLLAADPYNEELKKRLKTLRKKSGGVEQK